MEFDFDPAKSATNKVKHGLDFVEAQELWRDGGLAVVTSNAGIAGEVRFLAIGVIDGKHWTAIWTRRGDAIRMISVRRARKEEVAYYENG